MENKPAVLALADGTLFEGNLIGAHGTSAGELCFNTAMSGYQEVFTDPSYAGQIVVMSHTHIGNYGTVNHEAESNGVKIAGLVVKNFSEVYSRSDGQMSLQDYLKSAGVTGIAGIDTRALVRKIRTDGAMNAVISSEIFEPSVLSQTLQTIPNMVGLELACTVSTSTIYTYGTPTAKYKIAALDFGIKENILRCLAARDCFIQVFPAKTTAETLRQADPHGFFLSNGPGDPAAMTYAIDTVKTLLEFNKPVFGICLGHQILALASGLKTQKMRFGHRGTNHPVLNLLTNRAEITSQNHGFSVIPDENNSLVQITHVNLNDNTVEGLQRLDKQAFSVQYHPESSPGPHDSRYLFDNFIKLLN